MQCNKELSLFHFQTASICWCVLGGDNFLCVAARDNGSSSESKSESGTSASSSARPRNPRGDSQADPGMAYVSPVPGRRPEKQVMMKPASHSVSPACSQHQTIS